MLVLLAAWSWASALSMYLHIGSANDTDVSCILVPKSLRYDTELSSVWEMRFAEVVERNTGPTGTVILDYHAILVVPSADKPRFITGQRGGCASNISILNATHISREIAHNSGGFGLSPAVLRTSTLNRY